VAVSKTIFRSDLSDDDLSPPFKSITRGLNQGLPI